jgi:DHA1 family tetracycline resistance protein-like MFS transporter
MLPETSRVRISFILVTILIDTMGIGLVMPVLPSLIGEFTKSVESQAYWYGAVMFTFGFTQFFCAPLLGAISDRYGRRLVLLLSIGGLGSMFLLSALVKSLPALVLARIIGGALASNVSVANAYVADITTPENRAKSFGLIGAAFGVGFILGPMIGGLVGNFGVRLPFLIAAGLAIVNFAYGLFVLPESLPKDRRRPIDLRKANPLGALVGLARLKGVGLLVTVIALVGLAQFVMFATWVLFNTFRWGWGPFENGASFFAVGAMVAIVQGVLLGRLLEKFGERRLVLGGLASAMFAYLGYGLVTHGWMMFAVLGLNFLGFTVAASLNAVVSKAAPANEQGLTMGSLSSLNSAVAVLGPVLGIPIFARVSRLPRSDVLVGAPFFLSASLTATALGLAIWHFTREKRREAVLLDDAPKPSVEVGNAS